MDYQSYQHIEYFNKIKDEYADFNDMPSHSIDIFEKLDGTNTFVSYNPEGDCWVVGSRKRKISVQDDNAGFAAYIEYGDDDNVKNLRQFLRETEGRYGVYGEWLGSNKFVGTIKYYLPSALGLHIFDVYDSVEGRYLSYDEYSDIFNLYNYIRYIPRIDTVSAIDADQLAELAKEATYMLPEGKVGEGVVIKDYDYRYYGCQQFFKLVVDEFFEQKRANRKERTALEGGIECVIVDKFATVSEIEKSRSKTLLRLGDDAELERVLPMTMELVFHDIVQENGYELAKMAMKNGVSVDFGRLRKAVQDKVRFQILGR